MAGNHDRPLLPLTVSPVIHCNLCFIQILLSPLGTGAGGHRFMFEHGVMSETLIGLTTDHMKICPNNGKRWIVEFQQPWIYEMDPATGEIDTFGGRVV